MAFPERGDVKFLEVFELEIEKNDARDVMRQELLDDAGFKASILHPFGNLERRPAPYLTLVKLCNCSVEGAERTSLGGLRSSRRNYLGDRIQIRQWLDYCRRFESQIKVGGAIVRQGASRRDPEQMWPRRTFYWLVVKVELEGTQPTGVWCVDLIRR